MAEPLERTLHVRCPIGHAFFIFTEQLDAWWPRGHRRYAASRMVLEVKLGGRFFEQADSGEEVQLGAVLACEPPYRISYTWHPGAIRNPTHVDIRFEQRGSETAVHVTHSEGSSQLGPAWPERVQLFARGWDRVLSEFVACAERGALPEGQS